VLLLLVDVGRLLPTSLCLRQGLLLAKEEEESSIV
jgi:hypothetical protein